MSTKPPTGSDLSSEDILVARLKRMSFEELLRFSTNISKSYTDDEYLLETGWTRYEAIHALLHEVNKQLEGFK